MVIRKQKETQQCCTSVKYWIPGDIKKQLPPLLRHKLRRHLIVCEHCRKTFHQQLMKKG